MGSAPPKISICIPHWQVKEYMQLCLRSIRKHSRKYDLEVIVVDNGSKDDSLQYLRSLDWIRLIERPEETCANWPENVFTAWDLGIRAATSPYFITMHTDVFIRTDNWLDPFLREIRRDPAAAGIGAWKLDIENPIYAWQKRVVGYAIAQFKSLIGRKKHAKWQQGHYPRDYCAMYRRDAILDNGLTFRRVHGQGGGYSIAKQLWDAGHHMRIIPAIEMARNVYHVAHGTAAVRSEKPLNHRRAQKKVENKVHNLYEEAWIQSLLGDTSLDAPFTRAA